MHGAIVVVDRLDDDFARYALRDDLGAGSDCDARLVLCGRRTDAAHHVSGDIFGGQLAGVEVGACRVPWLHAVEPECTPRVAASVPRHQVPATPHVDEAIRLHRTHALRAIELLVVDLHHLMVAACGRDGCEHFRFHGGSASAWCDRDGVGLQRVDSMSEPGGKDLLELDERSHGRFFDP